MTKLTIANITAADRARVRRLVLRDQADAVASAHNRPTPERVAQAEGDVVELETDQAGVTVTWMPDAAEDDGRRIRALPQVNRSAGVLLRRVYLLARREPVVVGGYGRHRTPGDLPDQVAYAEVLVVRCRRAAGLHWPTLRAALIDDRWSVRDPDRLRTALRWLAGWWRQVAAGDGCLWDDFVEHMDG